MEFFGKIFNRNKKDRQGEPVPTQSSQNFPFEVLEVPGATAISALERFRKQGRKEGFTAVLLGDARNLEFISEIQSGNETPEQILEKAKAINAQDWFSRRVADEPGTFDDVEIGEWPEVPSRTESIIAHLEMPDLERPKKSVFIAKIPTPNNWEVPAALGLGGWNECPSPEVLTAISKYWHDRYGAEIGAVTGDTIEYLVQKPPTDKETADKLAREQFIFCSDIVLQGTQTLRNLAGGLIKCKVWYFWWD